MTIGLSERTDLARAWARALATTAYASKSRRETESLLRDLLDGLFDTLTAEEFSSDPAREIGTRLVAEHFTSEQSLSRTVEVLGQALLTHPELQSVPDLTVKAVALLGAIAAGHSAQLRIQTLDQQEQVKRALLQARRHAERELRISEAKFRELFTSSAVGIVISDLDGTVVQANQALTGIIGEPDVQLAGRSVYELLHPADVHELKLAHQDLLTRNRAQLRLPQRLRLLDKDGEPAWTYLAVSLLHDTDNQPVQQFMTVEDVTELHLLGESLRDQSLHDALTGLPNQQYFHTSLERVLARGTRVSVFMLNVDGMAVINDGFGRAIGDRLLQSVAKRLLTAFSREKATVARFGADNFAVFLEHSPMTPDTAALISNINAELAEPVYFDDRGLAVSCSIGVANREDCASSDPAELIRAAEAALHRVRTSGKRQWDLFDRHHDAQHRARCRLAAAMPGAWEMGEIGLDYQPLARLSDSTVAGVEALLRWDHPQSAVPHRECLELATWTGLMLPLVQWMLHQACAQFASWPDQVAALLHIDLTPQHAHDPDLFSTVRSALEGAGLAPERLQLGIPIAALEPEHGAATENLQLLAEQGVAVALLDCCGARAAALVEDLSVPTVELAPHLVRRITTQGTGSAVTTSVAPIVQLMRSAGAAVLVRGMDTSDQAAWWRSVGADLGQGAHFGPPVSSDEIVRGLGPSRGT